MMNTSSSVPKRADALDALRGLAILAMVFSGVIPFGGALPAWMYHAQVPPPHHTFNPNLPGLTWVDLVFPLFLFALGAAIPLAQSRYLAAGKTRFQLVVVFLKRGFLLGVFAIFLQHVRPYTLNSNPNDQTWWIALIGFVILFLMYTRWCPSWSKMVRISLTVAGWCSAIVLMAVLRYPDGSGFSLDRSDIILIVLTNTIVFGGILWIFTCDQPQFRLSFLAILLALRLSSHSEGWVASLWSYSPVPWIFQFDYLKYLFIVIPGTMVGDLLVRWRQQSRDEDFSGDHHRYLRLSLLLVTVIVLLLVGLQSRWVWQTTIGVLLLLYFGDRFVQNPQFLTDRFISTLYRWGLSLTTVGLCFEPYEGGIKKDSATFSYFWVTTGISIFILILFSIAIEYFHLGSKLQILIDNGRNPMIAYVGFGNLILPLVNLTGLQQTITDLNLSVELRVVLAAIYTIVLAILVSRLTRSKLFWRT
jgi:predicted acyltransferase